MQNINLTIPQLKVKEIRIETTRNRQPIVSIDIGLINKSGRYLSRIGLDANKPWSDANINLTDKLKELITEIITEIEKQYINDNLIELTEDYNDNAIK